MYLDAQRLKQFDRSHRIKLVNSLSGYKGVHLIGTVNQQGQSNVAIFNSVVHISAEPAMIGFIVRPRTDYHQTLNNIEEMGCFTINHVHKSFVRQAHYTSANFPREVSEFDACALEAEFEQGFEAPFVAESEVKMGLRLKEIVPIPVNSSFLVIGQVEQVYLNDRVIDEDGQLQLEAVQDVVVTGLNQYSSVEALQKLPYARVMEVPDFRHKERPDAVVFDDESQQYHAKALSYASSLGSPAIMAENMDNWKRKNVQGFNHQLKSKVEELKKRYEGLLEEYQLNEHIYQAKINFEPVVGETYHLYIGRDGKNFLSMIPPHSWNAEHLGAFRLTHDHCWVAVTEG